LKHTDQSVLGIALDAGYETHEAFTRAFSTVCGCSPSSFRKSENILFKSNSSRVHYSENGPLKNIKLPSGGKTMNVKIEKLEPMRVAFARHVGPYNEVSVAWDKLCTILGKKVCLDRTQNLSAFAMMTPKSHRRRRFDTMPVSQ
jgi:AraC family transcriptional regulator